MDHLSQLATIETPAVLLDLAKLESNLESMQRLADEHHLALRPHAKTHKSIELGRRQLALGASGLTVATVGEALVFLRHGIRSITISRPVVTPRSLDRLLLDPESSGADLRVVVDSPTGIQVAADTTARTEVELGVFIKIDVGLHRCGVDPASAAPVELAWQIISTPGLDFRGILSHAGQVYAVESRHAAVEMAEAERETMLQVRDRLIEHDIAVPEISVGATPTILAAPGFAGITEIRPGNYAFLDLLPIKVGVVTNEAVSLSVLATVISKNADFFITDAGSKTLTSDTGGHGMASAPGFGVAYPCAHYLSPTHGMVVTGLSEEHGKLARASFDLPIGAQVRIIPNHSCPVANLAREYVVLADDRIESWPIDAASNAGYAA
jgi:D-serine deaminase-like pyridoxal phosphate-dependent protein